MTTWNDARDTLQQVEERWEGIAEEVRRYLGYDEWNLADSELRSLQRKLSRPSAVAKSEEVIARHLLQQGRTLRDWVNSLVERVEAQRKASAPLNQVEPTFDVGRLIGSEVAPSLHSLPPDLEVKVPSIPTRAEYDEMTGENSAESYEYFCTRVRAVAALAKTAPSHSAETRSLAEIAADDAKQAARNAGPAPEEIEALKALLSTIYSAAGLDLLEMRLVGETTFITLRPAHTAKTLHFSMDLPPSLYAWICTSVEEKKDGKDASDAA